MNSEIIKIIAGGGKTTESSKILRQEKNGLYIAFNNEVVNEMQLKGFVSKTIDSLFSSYILPKMTALIPLVKTGAKLCFIDSSILPSPLKGISNLHIDKEGNILNKNKKTNFSLDMDNKTLHSLKNQPNLNFLKHVFGKEELRLTHSLRSEFILYVLHKYPDEIINLLAKRFSYIIFDETQDVKKHLEQFAILIYNSKIRSYYLGDCNQNINGGGTWFDNIQPTKLLNHSFRCPETNCKWIRENLNIDIIGNETISCFSSIQIEDAINYDDGLRILLYDGARGKDIKELIHQWSGEKYTIKAAKGKTLSEDIVIIGKSLNKKSYYTAITRTTKNVFTTISKVT